MKFLKVTLIVIGIIVVLFLLIAAFLPAESVVERSVVINASDTLVFNTLSTYAGRDQWDPWLNMDPTGQMTLSGPDSGAGATYSWTGEKIGSGHMTIKELNPYQSIHSLLFFDDMGDKPSNIFWYLEPVEDGTKTVWRYQATLSYPVERWFGLMMDSMLGPSFEDGLNRLKNKIESGT